MSDDHYFPFIPAVLDDCGLSATEFRLYAHIARRVGRESRWVSISSAIKTCGMDPKTVKRCLKQLVEMNLIAKEPRGGMPSVFKLNPPDVWNPVQKPPQGEKRTDTKTKTHPDHPVQKPPHKGYPIKVLQKGSPNTGAGLVFPLHLRSEAFLKAWADWEEYYPTVKRGKKGSFAKTFQFQIDKKLAPLTEPEAILWIEEAIANHWQGLYPPKQRQNLPQTAPAAQKDFSAWQKPKRPQGPNI